MRIQFCGADRTVTGSSHLIEVNGLRILLDLGMYQGPRDEARRINALLPEDYQHIDAIIDFSIPAGTMTVLPLCVERRIPLVVATTGHTAEQKQQIEAAAHHTAILFSPNMSLVVNVLFKLVREDGLKHREVAEILNISHNTVDVQMAIAIKKICAELQINRAVKGFGAPTQNAKREG